MRGKEQIWGARISEMKADVTNLRSRAGAKHEGQLLTEDSNLR